MIIFAIFEIQQQKNEKIQLQTDKTILLSNWKFVNFCFDFSNHFWYCFRHMVFRCFDKLGEQN